MWNADDRTHACAGTHVLLVLVEECDAGDELVAELQGVGHRDAQDRAVQSNVRNAFTATRIYYNEALRYDANVARMTEVAGVKGDAHRSSAAGGVSNWW